MRSRSSRHETNRRSPHPGRLSRIRSSPRRSSPRPKLRRLSATSRPSQLPKSHCRFEEDELTVAYRTWQEAKGGGDRKAARAHNERVVELLRPLAEQDLAEYGPRLLYALEELSSARLRAGELFASRGPAREAKALAKALGRR